MSSPEHGGNVERLGVDERATQPRVPPRDWALDLMCSWIEGIEEVYQSRLKKEGDPSHSALYYRYDLLKYLLTGVSKTLEPAAWKEFIVEKGEALPQKLEEMQEEPMLVNLAKTETFLKLASFCKDIGTRELSSWDWREAMTIHSGMSWEELSMMERVEEEVKSLETSDTTVEDFFESGEWKNLSDTTLMVIKKVFSYDEGAISRLEYLIIDLLDKLDIAEKPWRVVTCLDLDSC